MGLVLKAKGYEGESLCVGYIGFGWIRRCIANSYNEEFGKLYERPYVEYPFKGYTQVEADRWDGFVMMI